MNPNMTKSLVSDHIRESRQQAAARHARTTAARVARRGHRLVRGA